MKSILSKLTLPSLLLLGVGVVSLSLSGCATGEGAGKIGPDYESPQMKQLRMQEAQSRVTRSLIR